MLVTLLINKRPSDDHYRRGTLSIQNSQIEEMAKVNMVEITVYDSNNVPTHQILESAEKVRELCYKNSKGDYSVLKFK